MPEDPAWLQADNCVRTWIYNSIADDVIDSAIADGQTARDLWERITELFTTNRNSRVVYLCHEFHSIVQGDLSITEYMQKIKVLADALRDTGSPVRDDKLVLNALCGLSPRLSSVADLITIQDPMPNFSRTTDLLKLKELNLTLEKKTAAASAFLSASGSTCIGSSSCGGSSSSSPSPVGRGRGRGHGRGRGAAPPNPNAPGLLGARPPLGPPFRPWVCMIPWALGQPWPATQRPSYTPLGSFGHRPTPAPA